MKLLNKIKFLTKIVLFLYVCQSNAATLYFNNIYKGSGTTYSIQPSSVNSISKVIGTNFNFTSADPTNTQFVGNNVNGILSYVNSSGQKTSITGTISRQDKSGNTTLSVVFVSTDPTFSTSLGEAYVLVIPGKEASYTNNTSVSTSSDSPLSALNDSLTTQTNNPIITIDSPTIVENAGYALFTISLSNAANANISFIPTLSEATAKLNLDYTSSFQYYNTSTTTWSNIISNVTIAQGIKT